MSGEDLRIYDWEARQAFASGPHGEPPGLAEEIAEFIAAGGPETTPPLDPADARTSQRPRQEADEGTSGRGWLIGVGTLAAIAAIVVAKDALKGSDRAASPAVPIHCPAPTPRAMRQVEALFGHGSPEDDPQTAAQASGVHIEDTSIGLYDYTAAASNGTTTPAQELSAANQELRQFGLTVQAGTGSANASLDGFYTPTQADLRKDLGPALDAITTPITNLPEELVQLSGIKKIILMSSPGTDYLWDLPNPRTLVWNISGTGRPYPYSMAEALERGIDRRECGSYENIVKDPAYAALDGGIDIYDDKPHSHDGLFSLAQFSDTALTAQEYNVNPEGWLLYNDPGVKSAYAEARQSGNYAAYCALVNHLVHQIVVGTTDGFADLQSDKEGIGALLLTPGQGSGSNMYPSLLSPNSPNLRSKALLLLARLDEQNPGVVKYLADVTERGSAQFEYADCPTG